jgi:predicted house-cleaning noncanonical NTP pyrophosphatase (MazG superfamily)
MSSDDHQDDARTVGDRIAEIIRSNERVPKKTLTDDELRKLKAAAGRLEQLLSDASNAETEELKTAVSKLDQLLKNINAGKDVAPALRLRKSK